MDHEIIHLPKDKWKGTILPMDYTTDTYYDVQLERRDAGYTISIQKETFEEPVTHSSEEDDYPDRLYADHYENAYAWGILQDGLLIAAMETDPEDWSNRLRITEIWVAKEHRHQGLGHALLQVAKEQARRERRRAVILETQSLNVNAVDFYIHEGFTLIGLDTCCYRNNDLGRKEVRLEFGWFPQEKRKLTLEDIELRSETQEDHYQVELMTQHAFWNKHHLGCDEHYLVHRLREHRDYLPKLSRIAVKDGKVIGCILYSRSTVVQGEESHEIITFGPLCVEPEWQGFGVGELLLTETMKLAKEEGYRGIVIFGEPDYYPRLGFKTCDAFRITTADGKNFDAFMGLELVENGLSSIPGRFIASQVFDDLPKEEVEKYNEKFPPLMKMRFPDQWD